MILFVFPLFGLSCFSPPECSVSNNSCHVGVVLRCHSMRTWQDNPWCSTRPTVRHKESGSWSCNEACRSCKKRSHPFGSRASKTVRFRWSKGLPTLRWEQAEALYGAGLLVRSIWFEGAQTEIVGVAGAWLVLGLHHVAPAWINNKVRKMNWS